MSGPWKVIKRSNVVDEFMNEPDAKAEAQRLLAEWSKDHANKQSPFFVSGPSAYYRVTRQTPRRWTWKQIAFLVALALAALLVAWCNGERAS